MEDLCARIAVEKDHRKFLDLVNQLNDLLDRSHDHLKNDGHSSTSKVP